jgi:hypothetical protein
MKIGGRSGIVEKNRNKRGAKRSIEKKMLNIQLLVISLSSYSSSSLKCVQKGRRIMRRYSLCKR